MLTCITRMAKKKKNSYHVQKREFYQRVNFLYQASHVACTMKPPNLSLSQYYASQMKRIANRNVIKLSPHIKRNICKNCFMLLLPGTSCKLHFKKDHILSLECLNCHNEKRYPCLSTTKSDAIENTKEIKDDGEDQVKRLWQDKQENIEAIVKLTGHKNIIEKT